MAAITDLTFEQVNDVAIADPNIGEAIFSITGDVISLNVKALTGDAFTAITDEGFVEMMLKLNKIASETQAIVNETATLPEEELTSFPTTTYGLPDAKGNISISYVTRYSIPLNINNVKGVN